MIHPLLIRIALTRLMTCLGLVAGSIGITCCGSTVHNELLSGAMLAEKYCGRCHLHVLPTELPRHLWKDKILPQMGQRMGIYADGEIPDSLFNNGLTWSESLMEGIYPERALLSKQEWEEISEYYQRSSLEAHTKPAAQSIPQRLDQFEVLPSQYTRSPPLTTMLHILPETNQVVLADGKQNVNALIFLDQDLLLDEQIYVKEAITYFKKEASGALVLSAGQNIYPNDFTYGELLQFAGGNDKTRYSQSLTIASGLRRPVFLSQGDIDKDHDEDFIISEFGNQLGSVSLLRKNENTFAKEIILPLPGAIKTELFDMDGDGWLDVLVLMSQGREGFFLLQNNQGKFEPPKALLEFSPLMGSSHFELIDFNQDGLLDILYTAGDNADQSQMIKSFHGIYIFMNRGDRQFEESYFFYLPGAYRAIARDFDQDGDLDIAGISFFPDYESDNPVPFVYLQQDGHLNFKPSTFENANAGRWITMDVGDLDGDEDLDIALGSFVRFYPTGDTTGLFEKWVKNSPSVMLLKNTLYHASITPDLE